MTAARVDDSRIVGATTDVALERIETESPNATNLLSLCAFLAPDDIPRSLLLHGAPSDDAVLNEAIWDSRSLTSAVSVLNRYGLLQVQLDALAIHRTRQAVVRERLEPDARRRWCAAAAQVVLQSFPANPEPSETWPDAQRLLPHAIKAVEHLEHLEVEPLAAVELRVRFGRYLTYQGRLAGAKASLGRALEIVHTHAPDSREHATVLNHLAVVHRELGVLQQAKRMVLHALAIHSNSRERATQAGSAADPASSSPARLGLVDAGRGADEQLPADPEIADDLRNLGTIAHRLGDMAEGGRQLDEAMDMLLKLHGDASPELLPLLSSMMELLVAQERWADALRVVQHSIRIRTETGRVHSHEALVDEFWVQLLTNPEGVVERAADLADHLEREFGPLHPETAAGQSVLAMFLRHTGDIDQARARLLRAVEINRAIFGPQHYRVATGVLDLAAVAAMSGDAVAFELQFREALGIVTAAPEGELDSYVRMSRLDSVLLDIAVDDRSRPVVRKVLDIVRDASADESMVTFILPLLIRAERRAGDTLLAAGRSAEALAEYQYGLELARLTVDTQLDDAELLVRLGFLTAMDGDPDGSAETFREAMRCMVDGHILEPIWALIAQCGLIVSVTGGWTAVRPVLDALFDEAKEAGVMTEFRPEIVAAVPDGWFVKGSTTLLAPDGQANVIASSEPLDPSIDSEQYATVQQELLKKEFPEFALKSFERVTVLGDREGYVSTFEWTPPDSQRIAQAQLYYAENGRGYTATATTPAINLTALEPILHEVLRGLRLERNSTGG